MARYKAIDTSPRFLAVDLEKQLLTGSFEYSVYYLLEHEFSLAIFDASYRNDLSGALPIRRKCSKSFSTLTLRALSAAGVLSGCAANT